MCCVDGIVMRHINTVQTHKWRRVATQLTWEEWVLGHCGAPVPTGGNWTRGFVCFGNSACSGKKALASTQGISGPRQDFFA